MIKNLEFLSGRSPDDIEILKKLAVLYSMAGEDDKSISYLLKIQRIRPDDPEVHYNLACLYTRRGQSDEATGQIRKAIEKGFSKKWILSGRIQTSRASGTIRT
jgi:Flp pilus assembly protein TadD